MCSCTYIALSLSVLPLPRVAVATQPSLEQHTRARRSASHHQASSQSPSSSAGCASLLDGGTVSRSLGPVMPIGGGGVGVGRRQ